uniref:Putative nuclear pore complex p54 component sc nup57 n=1 Tax=Corethrella appendiculata TaxID=1370023 RepID=U5EUL2_9DIPT
MNINSSNNSKLNEKSINLSRPIAESTHLFNTSSSSSRSGAPRQGTPKRKPTSPLFSNRTLSKPSLSLIAYDKIDKRVYTDAQSPGLVSRLVKYHEANQKQPINRSSSLTNLYSKPGQYPIVHLKKNTIRNINSPTTNTVSRIAPPNKTNYLTNSRSNILRSRSLILTPPSSAGAVAATNEPLTKQDAIKTTENENEPISHSGPDVEQSPRNVLEALKEISRKRINNEELDIVDRVKKQCKEISEIDGGISLAAKLSNIANKRAREINLSPTSRQSPSESEQSKKRLCTKNNDILSSLSSSLYMNTPKVTIEQIQPRPRFNIDQTFIQQTPASVSRIIPVTPLNEISHRTQQTVEKKTIEERISSPPRQLSKPLMPIAPSSHPKLTLFNKRYQANPIPKVNDSNNNKKDDDSDDDDGQNVSFVKPKSKAPIESGGKNLLKRVDKSKLSLMLSFLRGDDEDEIDGAKNTVSKDVVDLATKPAAGESEKKQQSETPTTEGVKISNINALINNPIKDSGLASNDVKVSEKSSVVPLAVTTTASSSLATTSSSAFQAPTFSFGIATSKAPASTSVSTTATASTTASSLAPVNFSTSFTLPKSSFSVQNESNATNNNTSVTLTLPKSSFSTLPIPTSTSPSAATSITTSSPSVPTFSFGNTVATTSTNNVTLPPPPSYTSALVSKPSETTPFVPATTTTNPIAVTKSITFPFAAGSTNTFGPSTVTLPTPSFSFGGQTTKPASVPATTISTSNIINPTPLTTSFAFGSNPNKTTATNEISSPNKPAVGGFSFNAGNSAFGAPKTITSPVGNNVSTASFFAFTTAGNTSTTTSLTSSTTSVQPTPPPPYTFGQNTAPASSIQSAPTATPSFAFGQTTSSTEAPSIFGQQATTTTQSMFGATKPNPTPETKNLFAFGGNNTDNKPSVPTTSPPSFNFGGNNNNNNTFGGQNTTASAFGKVETTSVFGGNTNAQNSNIFGTTTSAGGIGAAATTTFGGQSTFNFNSSAPTNNNNNVTATVKPFSFGGTTTFGNTGSNNNNAMASNNNSAFNFGGNQTANTQPVAKTNSFSFTNAVNSNNNTAAFNFTSPTSGNAGFTSPPTGTGAPGATGFSALANTNSGSSFNFTGQQSQQNVNTSVNKTFNFGSAQTTGSGTTGNLFGNNVNSSTAIPSFSSINANNTNQQTGNLFNLSSINQQPQQQQQTPQTPNAGGIFSFNSTPTQPGANPFAPVSSGTPNAMAGRRIRTVARRLK